MDSLNENSTSVTSSSKPNDDIPSTEPDPSRSQPHLQKSGDENEETATDAELSPISQKIAFGGSYHYRADAKARTKPGRLQKIPEDGSVLYPSISPMATKPLDTGNDKQDTKGGQDGPKPTSHTGNPSSPLTPAQEKALCCCLSASLGCDWLVSCTCVCCEICTAIFS